MSDLSVQLPSLEDLARLVSGVTEQMFGLPFALAPEPDRAPEALSAPTARAAQIRLSGTRPLSVAIALDLESARDTTAVAFACPPEQVDGDMIDDLLRELVNIVAGQLSVLLWLDHGLSLPVSVDPAETTDPARWHGAALRSDKLILWIAVGEGSPEASPKA